MSSMHTFSGSGSSGQNRMPEKRLMKARDTFSIPGKHSARLHTILRTTRTGRGCFNLDGKSRPPVRLRWVALGRRRIFLGFGAISSPGNTGERAQGQQNASEAYLRASDSKDGGWDS